MSFTTTFADELARLAKAYEKNCPAVALFYISDTGTRGLRVEATAIMKEFVDNVEFGRDPEGYLFYDSPGDFKPAPGTSGTFWYRVLQNSDKPKPAVRVDFYGSDPSSNPGVTPFAQFLSKDTDTVDGGKLQSGGSGIWRDLDMGISSARLYKRTHDQTTTVTLTPIKKQITFQALSTYTSALDYPGVFHFIKLADLAAGSQAIANYDSDRILFYNLNDKKTLIGAFFRKYPS
ncbi:hypothetical protein BC834DRAFT_507190 [Gloeopeniophorella convolvens]|nr:hypothetical protein BC834DRAFT_507190 [Gloeopeniophorella convolvens]